MKKQKRTLLGSARYGYKLHIWTVVLKRYHVYFIQDIHTQYIGFTLAFNFRNSGFTTKSYRLHHDHTHFLLFTFQLSKPLRFIIDLIDSFLYLALLDNSDCLLGV